VLALVARMKRSEIRKTRSDDGWRILQCMQLAVRPALPFASSGLRNCNGKPGEDFCGDDVETFHVKQGRRGRSAPSAFRDCRTTPTRPSRASGRGKQTASNFKGDRKVAQLTTSTLETSSAGPIALSTPSPACGGGPGWGSLNGYRPDRFPTD
jgi:hypothetical protein